MSDFGEKRTPAMMLSELRRAERNAMNEKQLREKFLEWAGKYQLVLENKLVQINRLRVIDQASKIDKLSTDFSLLSKSFSEVVTDINQFHKEYEQLMKRKDELDDIRNNINDVTQSTDYVKREVKKLWKNDNLDTQSIEALKKRDNQLYKTVTTVHRREAAATERMNKIEKNFEIRFDQVEENMDVNYDYFNGRIMHVDNKHTTAIESLTAVVKELENVVYNYCAYRDPEKPPPDLDEIEISLEMQDAMG